MRTPNRDPIILLESTRRELAGLGLRATNLHPFASGLESATFTTDLDGRTVVVKRPWTRHISNDNDIAMDARDLLQQEMLLLQFARSVGIPTPEVVALHISGDVDLLVTERVPADGSSPTGEDLARILGALHKATPPSYPLIAHPGEFPLVIAERICRRAHVIERIAEISLRLPSQSELVESITRSRCGSLLHLDIRTGNILTTRGRIIGLVDWSNAVVGDPALELARIAEYGSAPTGFFAAYKQHNPVMSTAVSRLIYRLDAAVMLAVVFLSESPDRKQALHRLTRAAELAEKLCGAVDR